MTMSLWDAMTSKSSNFDLAVAYFIPEIMEEKKLLVSYRIYTYLNLSLLIANVWNRKINH